MDFVSKTALMDPLIYFSHSSSLCEVYDVVQASANLPLMRMNILPLTRNQLQEIFLLLLCHLHVSQYHFGSFPCHAPLLWHFSGFSITRCQVRRCRPRSFFHRSFCCFLIGFSCRRYCCRPVRRL